MIALATQASEELFSNIFQNLFSGDELVGMIAYIIFLIIVYVYNAIAWSKIAKKQNYSKPWIAWIPIVNLFLIPILAKKKWSNGFFLLTPILLPGLIMSIQLSTSIRLGGFEIFFLYIPLIIASIIIFLVFWIKYFKIILENHNLPGWLAIVFIISAIPFLHIVSIIYYLVLIGILAFKK